MTYLETVAGVGAEAREDFEEEAAETAGFVAAMAAGLTLVFGEVDLEEAFEAGTDFPFEFRINAYKLSSSRRFVLWLSAFLIFDSPGSSPTTK